MKKIKLTPEMITAWAQQGYSIQTRDYTRSIESDPKAVLEFCESVGTWFIDYEWEEDPRFKPAFEQIDESLSALEEFLETLISDSVVTILCTSPQLTVEIAWKDARVGLVLWDRFFVDCEDPVILLTLIPHGSVRYKLAPPNEPRSPSPMQRFHPERYNATRNYAGNFSKLYRQQADFNTGAITEPVLNRAVGYIIAELNERGLKYPRRHKRKEDNLTILMNQELMFAIAYGRFAQAGRQIMDFPPGLCEMLAHTDIGGIPVGEIRLPYVCQYLHFGTQKHLELEPGWFVDGAYIEGRGGPGEFKIVLTAKAASEEVSDLWYLRPEPSYCQSFSKKHIGVDLQTALEDVLRERLAELFGQEARAEDGSVFQEAKEQLAKEGLAGLANNVVDVSGKTAKAQIDDTNRRYPVFLEALKLIINGLLYITAYPEDIQTTWSEKAPFAIREKAINGNAREMEKAKSKLVELGYSPVHLCGKSFHLRNPGGQLPSSDEGHKSLHWRRGHWRNQVYGPGRTQHRLRWIMPMRVGGKNSPDDDPELGHIYLVS
jgi:hypothetical protein